MNAPPISYFIVSDGDCDSIGWCGIGSGIGVVVGGGSVGVMDVPNLLIVFYF